MTEGSKEATALLANQNPDPRKLPRYLTQMFLGKKIHHL